jgi:hypothetical protein
VINGRLSAQKLEALLQFALRDQEFFDFDPAEVQAAIRDEYQSDGSVRDSTDATTTRYRIRTADRVHEVSWYRLNKSAWDFPKVKRLAQLHAVDARLGHVFAILMAGDLERLAAVVSKMDELVLPFQERYPGLPRLTEEDLIGVTPLADGSGTRFTFSRYQSVGKSLFAVSIDVPQQGEPKLHWVMPPQ